MQLTKQQKIYVGALLLAGVAFGVDRFVLGYGPDKAAAAPRGPSAAEKPAPAGGATRAADANSRGGNAVALAPGGAVRTAGGMQRAGSTRSLAARLQEIAKRQELDLSAVPDAFQPSRRWDPPNAQTSAPVAPVAAPRSDVASQFKSRHKLIAVMNGRGGLAGAAIVGTRMLRIGQTLDGFTLVAIGDKSAAFEGQSPGSDEKVTVELVIEIPEPLSQ